MAVREAMRPLIKELRRRIYDYRPGELGVEVYPLGDTMRLQFTFRNLSSTLKNPVTASIKIFGPGGSVKVTSAHGASTGVTGVVKYDYRISTAASEGIYYGRMAAVMSQDSSKITMAQTKEFTVMSLERTWSDQELQDALDANANFVGIDPTRELLKRDVSYTRYFSGYDHFEWATLYDGDLNTSTAYTPNTTNLIKGEFVFTTAQNIELYLEGMCYDIIAAAAELLEELAADPERVTKWSSGQISQTMADPLNLAKEYRRRGSYPKSVTLRRVY